MNNTTILLKDDGRMERLNRTGWRNVITHWHELHVNARFFYDLTGFGAFSSLARFNASSTAFAIARIFTSIAKIHFIEGTGISQFTKI